ncbi:MAG: hypothetical protein IPM17_14170 [Verrucomicrobia bacterium]|jgi:hypothetical protein|nr:hypothetical protein [Verrucomicrobiota bacterium]
MSYPRLLSSLAVVTAVSVGMADKPVQLSFLPPEAQIVPENESVTAFRLSFYGRNLNMTGLDLGLANETSGDFRGFALGLVNLVEGNLRGVQWSAVSYAPQGGDVQGWISAFVSQIGGSLGGLQEGVVVITEKDVAGIQLGLLWSQAGGHVKGAQIGLVNQAASANGLQLGLVNLAGAMEGLQIGLWNQIRDKDSLKVLPLVNWKF